MIASDGLQPPCWTCSPRWDAAAPAPAPPMVTGPRSCPRCFQTRCTPLFRMACASASRAIAPAQLSGAGTAVAVAAAVPRRGCCRRRGAVLVAAAAESGRVRLGQRGGHLLDPAESLRHVPRVWHRARSSLASRHPLAWLRFLGRRKGALPTHNAAPPRFRPVWFTRKLAAHRADRMQCAPQGVGGIGFASHLGGAATGALAYAAFTAGIW